MRHNLKPEQGQRLLVNPVPHQRLQGTYKRKQRAHNVRSYYTGPSSTGRDACGAVTAPADLLSTPAEFCSSAADITSKLQAPRQPLAKECTL